MNSGFQIDAGAHPLSFGDPPTWASGWGQDQFGVFTEIAIEGASPHKEIIQRLRWIPPGQFTMGSPEDEEGRYDDEGPQTQITFQQGFWMFDTPVTQALWCAVMGGENPSSFKDGRESPLRPVEKVSWHDAQSFVDKVNVRFDGLFLRLPTEAEWEYSCRAVSTKAHYGTALQRGSRSLADIAWFSGNADSTTHPVKRKQPNHWGLYDTLGNVWEWCQDTWHESHDGANPFGAARDTGLREIAIRGGGWYVTARRLRASFRSRVGPAYRVGDLGFRCAGGQVASSSQPPVGSPGREAEPRPGAARGHRAQRD